MTDSETLKNADIGDKKAYKYETELYGPNMKPDELHRSDIEEQVTDADVEIRTDEYGNQHIKIIVEGEAMKVLPRRWDYAKEPRTEQEAKVQSKQKWLKHGLNVAGIAVTGIVGLGSIWLANKTIQGLTINGEQLQPLNPLQLVPVVLLFIFFYGFAAWAVSGGLPRGRWSL